MISEDARNPEAWVGRGNALYRLKNYEDAIKCYYEAIKIDPKNPEAWVGRGNALYRLAKFYEKDVETDDKPYLMAAIESYDKAIEIGPKNTKALVGKGNIYYRLKNYEDAIKCYDKAIEINPKNTKAWIGKSRGLTFLHRSLEQNLAAIKASSSDFPHYDGPENWKDDQTVARLTVEADSEDIAWISGRIIEEVDRGQVVVVSTATKGKHSIQLDTTIVAAVLSPVITKGLDLLVSQIQKHIKLKKTEAPTQLPEERKKLTSAYPGTSIDISSSIRKESNAKSSSVDTEPAIHKITRYTSDGKPINQ
jgi:tetratricopeptide (TPR) repeat protein